MTARKPQPPASATASEARARIIAAARRGFATMGYEGAGTRQIAAQAGVAQSLLLYHFGSKDALWRAVMDQAFAGLDARMAAAMAMASDGGVRSRLLAIMRSFIAFCAEDADVHRIMTIEGHHASERLRWLVEQHLRAFYRQACTLIAQGQACGVVRAGDPTLLYYSVIAIAGTAFSLAPEIALVSGDDNAVAPHAVEQLITALLFTSP